MSTDLNICHVWIVNNSGTQKWQNNRRLRGRFTEPAKSSVMDEVDDFLLPLICNKNIDSVPPCMSYYLMLGVEVTLLFGHVTTLLMARTCLIGQLDYRIFNSEILQIYLEKCVRQNNKACSIQNTRLQSVWLRQAVELPSVQAGATRARVHFLKNRWLLWVAELFSYSWMALAKCIWKCVMCNVQRCYQNGATGSVETHFYMWQIQGLFRYLAEFSFSHTFWTDRHEKEVLDLWNSQTWLAT